MEDYMKVIGQSLSNFQAALMQNGSSFEEYIRENYSNKWVSDELFRAARIRTTFVNSICQFLVDEGLVNLEKVMMSIVTDPLAHDIEHTPSIKYKGHTYVTTHSMIYCKFMACANPLLKGIFADSPNIRLEIESPNNIQRGKYIVDFSQIDFELRRDRKITLDEYYNKQDMVRQVLQADMDKIKNLIERMLVYMAEEVNKRNADDLKKLGIALDVP
jgi:aspartyl/asparaginyl-tRNA synthetase